MIGVIYIFQPDDDIIYFNERYLNGEMQVMFDELNLSLTGDEIQKDIGQLNLSKSCGPDNITNEFFKYGTDNLVSYVCKLLNAVFSSGYFSTKWSEGYIVPLHKKGSINEVENYRGTTLLSVFGKLFSQVLNNRLSAWRKIILYTLKLKLVSERKWEQLIIFFFFMD